jgi:hypothetical protein
VQDEARRFPIAARVNGQDLVFLGVDIPTGWFFTGFPDKMPLRKYQRKRDSQVELVRTLTTWNQALLTRGVHALDDGGTWRLLTPELVQRLGAAQDGTASAELLFGYFSGIGWLRPGDPSYRECDHALPEGATLAPAPLTAEYRRALLTLPGRAVLATVKEVASRSGTAPHTIWRAWLASDFIFTWRITLESEHERTKKSPTADLPPEMQAIGVE